MIGSSAIGNIKIGVAGVRVDDHLDRVADVVDAVGVALRVRVVIAGGVAVDNPHHAAVEDHGVRIAVAIEERRDVPDAVLDIAPNHDLAVLNDILGDEQVDVAEEDAEQQASEKSRDRHAARSAVVRKNVVCALGIVELGRRRIDHRVIVARLAKINRGLVNLEPDVRDRREYPLYRRPAGPRCPSC